MNVSHATYASPTLASQRLPLALSHNKVDSPRPTPSGTETAPTKMNARSVSVQPSALDEAAVTAIAPGDAGGAEVLSPTKRPVTIDEIRKAWGTNDPRCDLDHNGTVDMDDLLAFIRAQPVPGQSAVTGGAVCGTAEPPTPEPADLPGNPEAVSTSPNTTAAVAPQLTIDGFHKTWGQNDADYDLNGDGTVNMDDLLQFISSLPVPPSPAPPPSDAAASTATSESLSTPSAPDVATNEQPGTPALTLDGLLEAWSSGVNTGTNSPYDLNSDGTVNTDDLLKFIGSMSPGSSGAHRLAAGPEMEKVDVVRGQAASIAGANPARLQKLVDALIDRLSQAGFESQPPTNIRELVGALDLSQPQTSAVLQQLKQHYPRGLGVNLIG